MKISFVIAVYHNEKAVSETYKQLKEVLSKDLSSYEYEIIFIDDGSKDGSLQELIELYKYDKSIKVLSFTRNFGQLSAITAGFKEATGDIVINLSADLQDPIELIRQMVNKWEEGEEIVICHRISRGDSLVSKIMSKIAYSIIRLSIPQIPTGGFDFILMDRKAVDIFNTIEARNRFFQGDVLWGGYKISLIPYTRLKRTIGKSQYNLRKKIKYFLDSIIDASYLPIRFISALGVITALIGVIYSIAVIINWYKGEAPFAGWAPLMIVMLLIGGIIILMLGILGEYIWRIYDEIKGKPNYVIKDKYL